MDSAILSQWNSLERWTPTLFLIGGSLLLGHAAMLGVRAVSELTVPPDPFGPAGHLVALVGLLGLYPALVDRKPAMVPAAGIAAGVALVSWGVMSITRLLAVVGIVPSVSDLLPGVFFVLLFASTVFTYVLFSVAAGRTDDIPWTVGLLILAPAVLLVVVLVDSAVTGVSDLEGVVIGTGLALSMLALGYSLRTWDAASDQPELIGDLTAG